ncbi:unnamed protein product, partial [Ectocarpus sp. 4 AP-2014]
PCRKSACPTWGADASYDDTQDTAVAISASPTKRAATEDGGPARGGVEGGDQTKRLETGQRKKPTLPDPNQVNGSVMADPFNMDHIK